MEPAEKIERLEILQRLPGGSVLVDHGPMRMSIHVSEGGRPLVSLAEEGGWLAIRLLETLAGSLPLLKRRSLEIETEDHLPEVVRRMIEAAQKMEEPDLTPLAAVAGAISEVVADHLFERGGAKVIVENGGDIAIRLREGEVARVGIRQQIEARRPAYVARIDSTLRIEGVATSGLGGRSFTKGIASAATVFAGRASVADAAATVIGNFTDTKGPGIFRAPAEQIYPDTDIPGQRVTTRVVNLSSSQIAQALENGLSKAYELQRRGLIQGAFLAVQGKTAWTESLDDFLTPL